MIDGEPWFLGGDILKSLYGRASGNGHLYDKLTPAETSKVKRSHFGLPPGKDLVLVSESGLYKLIMRSDRKEALAFQHWIASEVLPSIRKTGTYALTDHGREAMPLPVDLAEALGLAVGQATRAFQGGARG